MIWLLLLYCYPHAFLYKSDGDNAIASINPSVCLTVMLSTPIPLDKIQPILVCEFLTCLGVSNNTHCFAHLLGPWWSQKVCLSTRWSGCLSLRPSVRHAISSYTFGRKPTKFCVWVAHINGTCNTTIFPTPWGPGEGQISLLTNWWYITYQTGFSFGHLGHAPGVGLGDTGGGDQKCIFFEIQRKIVSMIRKYHNHKLQTTP